LFMGYAFFTIVYQTGYSGNLKEMQVGEKSNVIARMGAHLDVDWKGQKTFVPGRARFYAWFVKGFNVAFGATLLWLQFTLVRLVIFVLLLAPIAFYLTKTTRQRPYDRPKELAQMGLMEICTIYLPIPLLLDLPTALILMAVGVIYYFGMNKVLWSTSYPRV